MSYTIDDVGPKIVKGKEIELTHEEKLATIARWEANEAAALAREQQRLEQEAEKEALVEYVHTLKAEGKIKVKVPKK